MNLPALHRIVTGHSADGRAIVSSEGPLPTALELAALPWVFHEVWSTQGSPAPLGDGPDPTLGALLVDGRYDPVVTAALAGR